MTTYSHDTDDLTVAMTADNAPSPNVTSASSKLGAAYAAWKAFIHDITSEWIANGSPTGWLKFDFGAGNTKTVGKYTLSAISPMGGNAPNCPKTWTFEGSNNDVDWDILDTQTDVPVWAEQEMRTYFFSNATAYRYYRINVSASQGGNYLTIAELELMEWAAAETTTFIDLLTEIKASETVLYDLFSSIKAGSLTIQDLNCFIDALGQSLTDLKSDIAADYLTDFKNLSTEISANAQEVLDLLTEIKASNQTLIDLDVEVVAKAQQTVNLLSEIKASSYFFYNLNTNIAADTGYTYRNLLTEIKAGCSAKYSFTTEWNPNRFLSTEIEAKKLHEFSFKTMTGASYSATSPKIELLPSAGTYPLRTLFLDYTVLGTENIYPMELHWARGLYGKDGLKNAKVRAEYIDTSYPGGWEIVTGDWLSCSINGGDYQTVNATPLNLGEILCDSHLDFDLKVVCRDCVLSRGLVFFKLIFTGDFQESIYGDSIVYGDGSKYHVGIYDDYESNPFVCRIYIVE